jgi:hypothetical protein
MTSHSQSQNPAELFLKEVALKKMKLTKEKINLACTFLLKVKDNNYLEIHQSSLDKSLPYIVTVYEGENIENALFESRKDAEEFVDTLNFINDSKA